MFLDVCNPSLLDCFAVMTTLPLTSKGIETRSSCIGSLANLALLVNTQITSEEGSGDICLRSWFTLLVKSLEKLSHIVRDPELE